MAYTTGVTSEKLLTKLFCAAGALLNYQIVCINPNEKRPGAKIHHIHYNHENGLVIYDTVGWSFTHWSEIIPYVNADLSVTM